jgi:hypothetical protein
MLYHQLNRRSRHDYNSKSYRMTFGSCGTFLFDIIQVKEQKRTKIYQKTAKNTAFNFFAQLRSF